MYIVLFLLVFLVLPGHDQVYGYISAASMGLTTTLTPSSISRTFLVSAPTTLPYHRNASNPYLGATPASIDLNPAPGQAGAKCVVIPLGWGQDDSSQILEATDLCGINGTITLPAPYVYVIARPMYMKLQNARLEVFGTLAFSADLSYWIDNSFRIEFQNQSTAWVLEGSNFEVDGGGWQQGGIDGNGQAWMTHAAGHSNLFGRPVSLSIYNSTNVTVKDFSIRQPQFWSFWIQDSTNVDLGGIYINGSNTDPYGNSSNFETNIDGLDSLRVDNITIHDWVFRGGDDCLAPKGNTTNLTIRNVTCIGGGIAFGSIGQYIDSPDYIENVVITNVSIAQKIDVRLGGAQVAGGIYFKSWVGQAEGVPPQGGGGGTGRVSNVSVTGLTTHNTSQAVYVNKCYYKVADQARFCDTSTVEFEELYFSDISGTVSSNVGVQLNCSAAAFCKDIVFEGVNLQHSNGDGSVQSICVNAEGVQGLTCNGTVPSS